jgi:hypothetical protein
VDPNEFIGRRYWPLMTPVRADRWSCTHVALVLPSCDDVVPAIPS